MRRLPEVLAGLLASLATAAIAHAGIDLVGALLGPSSEADAYADHAHGALGPVILVAVALFAAALLRAGMGAIARRDRVDPVVTLARRFATMRVPGPLYVVACGAFAVLITMEFTEQFQAFGHVTGVANALGGIPAIGVAMLFAAATAVTFIGLRFAHAVVRMAMIAAVAITSWRFAAHAGLEHNVCRATVRPYRLSSAATVIIARGLGLRAPPIAT